MSTLDLVIIGFTVLMAVWGYSQGLVVGALSLVGFVAGAFAGSRLGPLLLEEGSSSPYAPLVTLAVALLVGGVLATIGETVGIQVKARLGERLGRLDGAGGAALLACVGLLLAWMAGAVALQTPGLNETRREIQRSDVLTALNGTLPPSGPLLNALARFDPFPQLDAPAPDLEPPPPGIARDDDVQAVADSVVRVLGTACGLSVQGSGWVAGDGVVVTNAHVVAGQDDTSVQLGDDGAQYAAQAVHYDPRNDLAVLSVPDISGLAPALELEDSAASGRPAAVVGYPLNGPLTIEPGRLGDTIEVRSQDAYGRGPVQRRMTQLRAEVQSGNSGGPMVDGDGRVVTTVFAATEGADTPGGFGVPVPIVAEALAGPDAPVETGPCAA